MVPVQAQGLLLAPFLALEQQLFALSSSYQSEVIPSRGKRSFSKVWLKGPCPRS